MAGDRDSGMYDAYWDLRKEVEQIVDDIEASVSFGDELDAQELLAKLDKALYG